MKHLSTRYCALFAIGILLCVQLEIHAQTLLRITITHQEGDYTWHQNTIRHLQKAIESIAPSHLEAKLLTIEHTGEGNQITFDINQCSTKTIGNTATTILAEVKQIAYIISNRLHKALQEVINIPCDLFIYYNPAITQNAAIITDGQAVTAQADDIAPSQTDILTQEQAIDPIIVIISPDASVTETDNSLFDNIDSTEPTTDNHAESMFSDITHESIEPIELIAIIEESNTQQSTIVE